MDISNGIYSCHILLCSVVLQLTTKLRFNLVLVIIDEARANKYAVTHFFDRHGMQLYNVGSSVKLPTVACPAAIVRV